MPKLIKKIPNLNLVLTGGGFKKNFRGLSIKVLYQKLILNNFLFFSKCLCVPLKIWIWNRIKIIEALYVWALL